MRTREALGLCDVEQTWREHVARPREREWYYDRNLQEIRGMLGAKNWRQVEHLGGTMVRLGDWYCTRSVIEILDAAPEGWATMRRGLHWNFWGSWFTCEARARRNPHIRDRPMGALGPVERYALMFAHACGTTDDEVGEWAGAKLLQAVGPEKEPDWGFPFPELALHLYVRWKRLDTDLSRASFVGLGVYQRVLDTWDDPTQFVSALMAICDYHTKYARDDYDEEAENPPRFGLPPYNLFPADILVIQRIRTDESASMPICAHALLDTPLYRDVPATPPKFSDADLDEVRSNFDRMLLLAEC